jgi:hypothetical protein
MGKTRHAGVTPRSEFEREIGFLVAEQERRVANGTDYEELKKSAEHFDEIIEMLKRRLMINLSSCIACQCNTGLRYSVRELVRELIKLHMQARVCLSEELLTYGFYLDSALTAEEMQSLRQYLLESNNWSFDRGGYLHETAQELQQSLSRRWPEAVAQKLVGEMLNRVALVQALDEPTPAQQEWPKKFHAHAWALHDYNQALNAMRWMVNSPYPI